MQKQENQLKLALLAQIPVLSPLTHMIGLHDYLPATSDLNVCYTNGALVLRQMELLL